MACVSRSVISVAANTGRSSSFSFKTHQFSWKLGRVYASKFKIRASSGEADDCNVEECAPDKEVGKLSVEWLAEEKTRVVGTFPPRKRGWTGYIEKDTAGQTNIYSVEPTVYVAESGISSGTTGSSSDGSENTIAVAAGLGLICVAAASLILLLVGKSAPQAPTPVYSGPSLTYFINKFTPTEIVEASVPSQSETSLATSESETESSSASVESENSSPTSETETSTTTSQIESSLETSQSESSSTNESQISNPEVQQAPAESGAVLEPSASNADSVS